MRVQGKRFEARRGVQNLHAWDASAEGGLSASILILMGASAKSTVFRSAKGEQRWAIRQKYSLPRFNTPCPFHIGLFL